MRLGSSLRRRRDRTSRQTDSDGGGNGRGNGGGLDPRGRRILVGFVVALGGLLIGYLTSTRIIFPAPAPPDDLVEVPDARGRTLDQALELFAEAGLELGDLEEMQHPEADSGTVVGQAPLPGQLARPGATTRLMVSLGPERRSVPEVEGLRADRAGDILRSAGLVVQVDSAQDTRPRGRVVSISPAPGTEIALPHTVRITVSLGPPTVTMPSLLGLSLAEARDSIATLGLEVLEVDEVFQFGRNQGRVVGQEPPEGVELERGEGVRLEVGRRGGREREQ